MKVVRTVLGYLAAGMVGLVLLGACAIGGRATASVAPETWKPLDGRPGWFTKEQQGMFGVSTQTGPLPFGWYMLESCAPRSDMNECADDARAYWLPRMTAEDQQEYWRFAGCIADAIDGKTTVSNDDLFAAGRSCDGPR
jgi:hypothetical protein